MKIIDTSPIICLVEEIERPDLLHDVRAMNTEVVIPKGVKGEIVRDPSKTIVDSLCTDGIFTERSSNTARYTELRKRHPGLGKGEFQVFAISQEMMDQGFNPLCVVDDGLARKAAQSLGLNFTGIVGILKRLKQQGKLSQEDCSEIVQRLISSPFRINPDLLRRELLNDTS